MDISGRRFAFEPVGVPQSQHGDSERLKRSHRGIVKWTPKAGGRDDPVSSFDDVNRLA
jgi:hypothetical protein